MGDIRKTRAELLAAGLVGARGCIEVKSKTARARQFLDVKWSQGNAGLGLRSVYYYVGKAGSLRWGATYGESQPVADRDKTSIMLAGHHCLRAAKKEAANGTNNLS